MLEQDDWRDVAESRLRINASHGPGVEEDATLQVRQPGDVLRRLLRDDLGCMEVEACSRSGEQQGDRVGCKGRV